MVIFSIYTRIQRTSLSLFSHKKGMKMREIKLDIKIEFVTAKRIGHLINK